jgi:hypothetical protein
MLRYILFGAVILAGLVAGLYYGWELSPVDFGAGGIETLREDFKADYVLMVAEAYRSEQNIEEAMAALRLFPDSNPLHLVDAAITFAVEQDFNPQDIARLNALLAALLDWDPDLALTPTPND